MLTFDPIKHEYSVNGTVLPSVTQILAPLSDFSMIAPDVLEHKRQIGVAVHRAIELSILVELDKTSIAEEWRGYFVAWENFLIDSCTDEADIGVGKPLHDPTLGFAGTPDVQLYINGRWAVVDVKTAETAHPAWALQTIAYKHLLNVNTPKGQHPILDRFALKVREDGTYSLIQHKDKSDFNVLLSLLNVKKWRTANHV